MKKIFVLRHAHSTANERGVLAGRSAGIELSEKGKRQAQFLAPFLISLKIDHVITSPLARCQSTIAPFLSMSGPGKFSGTYRVDERLIEMDYGKWTGKKLSTLALRPMWRTIQRNPAEVEFPAGESFIQMQNRVDALLDEIAMKRVKKRSGENILLVTHGDICKYISARFLGLPFNDFQRFHVDPASLSFFTLTGNGVHIGRINFSLDLPHQALSQKFELGGSTR